MKAKNIVVIGVSTGGPMTLKTLFSELPPLDAAFLVVLHITPEMDFRIAQGIAASASMPAELARDAEFMKAGHIYLAPGGYHLKVEGNHRFALYTGPRVNYVQPSVDVTMFSFTRQSAGQLIGVILTGMGRDGALGLKHMKDIGATTIAQDQKSSVIYGMPKAALETGAVDYVLPPLGIAAKLVELLGRR
ncbi:chemotaxis protein CheB [Geomonas silvestris]|uniref:protein-glutamate methylesterase n=1 Tax=Geomonas silvestris TaxID=2740184 RepID=A0A6V8MKY4_9BACT|nr:CheB methylesterase domain-containing protein [Geomonas silvestris]GFO60658.1 chemotaxis protein CheB [Geomonas silvestris]